MAPIILAFLTLVQYFQCHLRLPAGTEFSRIFPYIPHIEYKSNAILEEISHAPIPMAIPSNAGFFTKFWVGARQRCDTRVGTRPTSSHGQAAPIPGNVDGTNENLSVQSQMVIPMQRLTAMHACTTRV